MRFSRIAVAAFFLVPLCLAAPVKRGLLDEVMSAINNVPLANVTLSGIVNLVADSMRNPTLTRARIAVIKSQVETRTALKDVASQANATGNSNVSKLVATAQGPEGLESVHQALNQIGADILSGAKGSTPDQKQLALGLKNMRVAVNSMDSAITQPAQTLSDSIQKAQIALQELISAAMAVLKANNRTLNDLGLPQNFADP